MALAVKKTVSLPPDLAAEAEAIARDEGKTLSAVVQEALRLVRAQRLQRELQGIQTYWSDRARHRGILSARDLERYLKK